MNHLTYLDPPIEVLASSPRLDMILSRLKAGRVRPFRADLPLSGHSADALLIDTASIDGEMLNEVIAQIGNSLRPIMVLGDASIANCFENAVFVPRDRDLTVLRGRLEAISRRTNRLSELKLRIESAKELGVELSNPSFETVPDLLYLGDGSARFLALQANLAELGMSLTAAFSVRTAADYARQKRFSAILIDITRETGQLDQVANWLSSIASSRPDTPIFGLMGENLFSSPGLHDLMNSLSHVFEQGADARELTRHVELHGRQDAGCWALTEYLENAPDLLDDETKLFSKRFLETHLSKQITISKDYGAALSVLALGDPDGHELESQDRKLLANLLMEELRETDLPSLLGHNTFVISLPATGYKGAVYISERIMMSLAQRAPHLAQRLGWRIVEARAYHDVSSILSEATSGVFQKNRAG